MKVVAFAMPLVENCLRGLTAVMVFSLNLFPPLLLQAATTANSASFSQTELVARYPAIAAASAVLLGLGFACDIYLFLLLWRRVHPSPTEAVEPMLRVAVKPWTMQDLAFVTGAVILAFALANSLMSIGLKLAHVNDERSTPWFLTLEMLLSMGCLLAMRAFFQLRNIDWRQAWQLHWHHPVVVYRSPQSTLNLFL